MSIGVDEPFDNLFVLDPTPGVNVIQREKQLLETAAQNMAVDGSSVNKIYKFAPASGELWYLVKFSFYLSEAGGMVYDKFGANTVLTNGIKYEVKSEGTTTEISNIKRNPDIALCFTSGSNTGSNNSWEGLYKFEHEILLDGDQGDFFQATVRDNLTGGSWISSNATVWKAN